MMEKFNSQEENRNRALDKPREYPLASSSYYGYQQEEDIHLKDYLHILLRRKWIVITVFMAVITTVTIATFMTKPLYKATVTLKIDQENQGMMMFKDALAIQMPEQDYYETQFRILKSKNLAIRVIRKMRLDSNPEFAGQAKHAGEPQAKTVSFLKQSTFAKDNEIDPSIVSDFISRLEVKPQPKSRLVNVSFISYEAELAEKVSNTIAKSFIELNMESKYASTQQAREWLEQQLEIMKAKVEQAEEKLNQYAAQNQIIFLNQEDKSANMNITTQRLTELSTELTTATSDRIHKEALYREIYSGDPDSSSYLMNNTLIQDLKKNFAGLEAEYSQNLKTYKPDYPKMIKQKELVDQYKNKISSETKRIMLSVKKDYEAALKREDYLRKAFDNQKQEALDLNSRSVQYQILRREADTNKELYNGLLQKLKETGISASLPTSNVVVLDTAEIPKSPFKPQRARNIILSMIFGLFGGVGLAFFTDYLDSTIKTPEDVEKKMFMPSLGIVPIHAETTDSKNMPVEYISHSNSKSLLSEAYSSIRTFLLFSSAGKPPKVMMVTSAQREEGKTTTAINTAISLTKSNARAILIDADMRKPRIHKVFKLSNTTGLSSFLSGNCEFDGKMIKPTKVEGLDILTSGPIPPNPAELLSSYRLRDLIDGLSPLYNFIIFDTPPILGLADAAITSTQTEGVILVIKSGHTPKEAAQQAKKILESVDAKVLGVVLNGISHSNMRYGNYSYYQYDYQNDTSDEKK
jgi:capsular exopolysaccharide synthesis family protein